MRAGPKGSVKAEPLSFKGWPRDRAARRMRFVHKYLLVPRGHGAGKRVRLRDFQKEIIGGAFAPGIRTAVVAIPRANGKTSLAAMLGLAELFVGPPSAEVLVVASDERQAGITLRLARRMVELHPDLESRVHVYQDRIVVPHNDGLLLPMPAQADAIHGHDPSLLIVDELHLVTRPVWEAATTAGGKRAESITLAISTPSSSEDSVMWDLIQHGRAGDDPAFYLKEFSAPDGCDVNDRDAWRIANPALSDPKPFLAEDALAALVRTTREPVFRQLRLGQWVKGVDSWLPFGAWDERSDPTRVVADRESVVLGFDGSASGDSTALIGATVEANPHVFTLEVWENPGDERWRVPRAEVDRAVDMAHERYDVQELAADPWGWRSEIESWTEKHKNVIEWPTNIASRMGPATDRLFQLVMEARVTHDGDARLARHVTNCIAKPSPHGDLVTKDRRMSPRKIDAAVAAVVAVDRAAHHAKQPKRRRVYVV